MALWEHHPARGRVREIDIFQMRQSELFTKTQRHDPKDEESVNARLLVRAGFIDKVMAGVYTLLPLGLRVFKKIEYIIREEMEYIGGVEIMMPTLQPRLNWERTDRWNSFEVLFRLTSAISKTDYAVGPTHEEIIAPLMKKHILSYKDLPRYVFQIQNKFRDEKRAKSGLLRGREFVMKDLYSFHRDEEDLNRYYEIAKEAYRRIFNRVGIGAKTFLTFASGGTFSKCSHEFQTINETGEDTIHLCNACMLGVNAEIINEQKSCPGCGRDDLRVARGTEVGNIFKLMTKYSKPFGLAYRDEGGRTHDVLMGCYGIGLQRLMGTVVEVSHDEHGIIWPDSIAPYRAHLVELPGGDGARLYRDLQKEGIEVLYDDREVPPGEKLVDADLIGIPYRLVVSEKTGEKVEVKRRSEDNATLLKPEELIKKLTS